MTKTKKKTKSQTETRTKLIICLFENLADFLKMLLTISIILSLNVMMIKWLETFFRP